MQHSNIFWRVLYLRDGEECTLCRKRVLPDWFRSYYSFENPVKNPDTLLNIRLCRENRKIVEINRRVEIYFIMMISIYNKLRGL